MTTHYSPYCFYFILFYYSIALSDFSCTIESIIKYALQLVINSKSDFNQAHRGRLMPKMLDPDLKF